MKSEPKTKYAAVAELYEMNHIGTERGGMDWDFLLAQGTGIAQREAIAPSKRDTRIGHSLQHCFANRMVGWTCIKADMDTASSGPGS